MERQLTKDELKVLEVGQVITEKVFNETNNWEVYKTDQGQSVTHHLIEINSKKRTKLIVSDNFNKEGDRKYKSPHGQTIVKYYEYNS